MQLLIIGGGNMGLTYAQSFVRSHITSKANLMILEKNEDKAKSLTAKDVGTVYGNPADCVPKADLIVLAVKPQDIAPLFAAMRPFMTAEQVVLSIMAGVSIETISKHLGIEKVVRAMPNLPAQIGMGMTAYTSSDAVTRIELVMVQNLLNTTGKTVYVEQQNAIDSATAISGSGPAYVWLFMDAMMQAARKLGFNESESELLVAQTFRGAIDLYNKSDSSCTEWIQRVCSKGGTTEAALQVYQNNALYQDIIDGADAAFKRAVELGKLDM